MTKITPLFARVIIRPKKEEEITKSGIVLPGTVSKDKPNEGEVIAVGTDCKQVKAGDMVLFKQYSPTEVKINDEKLFVVDEEDILAKIK